MIAFLLISRFYEQFSRNDCEIALEWMSEKPSNFKNMSILYIGLILTLLCSLIRARDLSLIDKLKELMDDIKNFNNVHKIFICKIPPGSDHHRINSKVSHYNSLLVETLSNVDNGIIVENQGYFM